MAQCVLHRVGSTAVHGCCGLALLLVLGCARHEPVPVPVAAPASPPATPAKDVIICKIERETAYDLGLRAYDAGEVKRAMTLWREAAADADQTVRQKALFAMAGVRLAQANTEGEMAVAMELFDTVNLNCVGNSKRDCGTPWIKGEGAKWLIKHCQKSELN